jgi:tricorn protease-like protein
VNVSSGGSQAGPDGGFGFVQSISADGRYVAFRSMASNLVAGDSNATHDVFVHDRQTGQTARVSLASDGAQGNNQSTFPWLSADGRYVAFRSVASNLVPGDSNGSEDIFVHDRQTGQTTRVSLASSGAQSNSSSIAPAISADGRFIAFDSAASNLVADDTNGRRDIFVAGGVSVSPTTITVPGAGATRSVNVSFEYPGTPWTATTTTPWITIEPPAGGSANSAVNFTVAANTGAARTGTIVVALQTVTVQQDATSAPVAFDGAVTVPEDTTASGTLNATDPNGDVITFSLVSTAVHGTVTLTNPSTGAYSYTPAENFHGADSFTFQATAGGETSNVATVSITVTPVNDAPVAVDRTFLVFEDTSGNGSFLAFDADNPASVTFVVVTPPVHGTVTIPDPTAPLLGGRYVYVPHANYHGPDSFTYRVIDGALQSNLATVTIDVLPINDAPVATGVVVATQEGTAKVGALTATDADGGALTFGVVTPPTKGVLTITDSVTGAFTYMPNAGAFGYDTFTFNATDGSGASSTADGMVFIVANSPRWPGQTVRGSVPGNRGAGVGESIEPVLSADGRYVTFSAIATNFVPGDTNGWSDVFVFDRQTGQTTRVSVASNSAQANHASLRPSISAEGRYVSFYSFATNLVSGDTNGTGDIYVHDRQTGQTTRVSIASDGTQGNGESLRPILSADGRFVAFSSNSSNLVPGDTNGTNDVFLHDRQTGETTRLSVASGGGEANFGGGTDFALSQDARYLAFSSGATNLVAGDTNAVNDIFVHDRQTGLTTQISVATNGGQSNGRSYLPALSADGRYVAFTSDASNLVADDTNGSSDVFVHDRQTGATVRVSIASDASQGNSFSSSPSLSADARYVTFTSSSTNFTVGDTNGIPDVFVHDRQTGATVRVNVASDGTQADRHSQNPSLSADGRHVAFSSLATNLAGTDTNDHNDVFIVGGASVTPTTIDIPSEGGSRTVNVSFAYPGTPWTAATTDSWITISPPAGGSANGTVTFTVAPNTGAARTGTLTVALQTVTVNQAASTAPVAHSSSLPTTPEDTSFTGTLTATDPNGDPITFSLVSLTTHGTVVLTDVATGAFSYTPASNFHGLDDFTFQATAGGEVSNVARIVITVTPVNDTPVAVGGTLATVEDVSEFEQLQAADVDGDPLTFSVVTPPAHGTVTIITPSLGVFRYTPALNYHGPDSFTFRASDGGTVSNVATVSVTVAPVNDAPIASSVVVSTQEAVAANGTLPATDVDGDALTFTVVTPPTRGTLTITNAVTGAFTYVPNAGARGYDTFTFAAADSAGASSTATGMVFVTGALPRWPGQPMRVSVSASGTQASGLSGGSAFSADGRLVAFVSNAPNLVPADTNAAYDVFVRDFQTGALSRVSVATDGTQANGPSTGSKPAVSADGRFIAFQSDASNLVPGDTNFSQDVFVHDRQTGQTTRVSVASNGTQATNRSSSPKISADGRYVVFFSEASNLVPDDTNGAPDVFVHDRQTGQTTRVNVASDGAQTNFHTGNDTADISADGRYVAFSSWAPNLVPGDTNNQQDVFVHDRETRLTSRVSVASNGTAGNGFSGAVVLSADARFVAFLSGATNLVEGDTNGLADLFVRDMQTGQVTRVNVSSTGSQANDLAFLPAMSADGRFVAFDSPASNLVADDTNNQRDVFVHDRQTGETVRVSVAGDGTQSNGLSVWPSLSADGRYVAFDSEASNLMANDSNANRDVFVVGMLSVSPTSVTIPAEGDARTIEVSFDLPGTPWTASTATPWIMLTGPVAGTGSGNVTFLVMPNGGAARTGTVIIASQTVTVIQEAFVDSTPPTVLAPAPISVYATVPGGATPATVPALAAFLAGATAFDNAPATPITLAPQLNGVDVTPTTVFPLGSNTVTFAFRDASGNVGTATSVVTVLGGRPSLTVTLIGAIGPNQQSATLRVSNSGTGNALGLNITLTSLRVLTGTGAVTLVSGLPASVPVLAPGQSLDIPLVLTVPLTVQRFAISESLTMTDYTGALLTTTATQTVFQDSTAPTFLVGPAFTVTPTTMRINWTTSEPATSRLDWGIGTSTNRVVPEDSVYKTNHEILVTGLLPNTTYSFIASGHDRARNLYVSSRRTARTNP